MSEHQLIAFRALDKPVSRENLVFMQKQSSRAEVTPWALDNEYEYGDFRGNVNEMLRRGYDLYLHFANFGNRRLCIRFAQGLPNLNATTPYFGSKGIKLVKDPDGPGVILNVQPDHEAGFFDDYIDFDDILERIRPLRDEIAAGDLRPLYLMHLAMMFGDCCDPDEVTERPVPAGLDSLTPAQQALCDWYELETALVQAAAQQGPPMKQATQDDKAFTKWVQQQPTATKDAWLTQLVEDRDANVRSDILAAFQQTHPAEPWPTAPAARTIEVLQEQAESISKIIKEQKRQEELKERAKYLKGLAADPQQIIAESIRLVDAKSAENYQKAAQLLADLHEALSGTPDEGLAVRQATQLVEKYPTRQVLVSAMRSKLGVTVKPTKKK